MAIALPQHLQDPEYREFLRTGRVPRRPDASPVSGMPRRQPVVAPVPSPGAGVSAPPAPPVAAPTAEPPPGPPGRQSPMVPPAPGGLPQRPVRQAADTSDIGTLAMVDAIASGLTAHRPRGRQFDPQFWQGVRGQRGTEADKAYEQQVAEYERQQALAKADPESEASRRAQRSMGPMLERLGMQSAEISFMSAADIEAIGKGGAIPMALAEARRKAETAKAEATARAQAAAEKRAYDEQLWEAKNRVTSQQAMERARVMSGMAGGRQMQQALLLDDLSRRREAERAGRRVGAEERAEERTIRAERRARIAKQQTLIGQLKSAKKKLAARDPDSRLPLQTSFVERGAVSVKAQALGGSGMSAEDTSLDTALTALGLQDYIHRAGNAPNTQPEQRVANRMYRGNGTVGSAKQQIEERIEELESNNRELEAASRPGAQAADDDDLGVEWD